MKTLQYSLVGFFLAFLAFDLWEGKYVNAMIDILMLAIVAVSIYLSRGSKSTG